MDPLPPKDAATTSGNCDEFVRQWLAYANPKVISKFFFLIVCQTRFGEMVDAELGLFVVFLQ
jgi:hypothetical protein